MYYENRSKRNWVFESISMSPLYIKECFYVYKALVRKEKPEFLNEKVKEILDRCGIKTITCGIGWKIA